MDTYQGVLTFWFEEIKPEQWWVKDIDFDELITSKFGHLHQQAEQCELFHWRETTHGRLAEVIILDQFSRNIYRDTAQSFASDPLALALAQEAISIGAECRLTAIERNFLYMPYMHSESLKIHEQAVILFKKNGLESNLEFEYKHKTIIEKYGRYPHRNDILGRKSTPEEQHFLTQPGSGF